CFFQKHWTGQLGKQVKHFPLREKDGTEEEYPYATDSESLLALVQMNTLEFHTWGSRIDAPEKPDRLVFDLDPDAGLPWARVGAPVAMPISWAELARVGAANAFDLRRALKRAATLKADPWQDIYALKQRLPKP